MLILTRKIGETIMIGDDINVTVLNFKGNQVRIGINAPKNVTLHREEIYKKIKEQEKREKDAFLNILTNTPGEKKKEAVEDLFWALMTSREFLFQH